MKKVIITGPTGTIGVALADAGGQGNGFGAAIHQHPGAGHGPLAGC